MAKTFELYITRNDILQNGLLMLNFSMGKVIYLPEASKTELSVLMIKTLHAAYKKQKHNKPIGQRELDGSFTALVNRNLIK